MASAGGRTALIINLTRFGDLLQSQPLIEDLHGEGWRTHLICLENFSAALCLLRHVERAWPLKGGCLLAGLAKDWRKAHQDLLAYVRGIRQTVRPDLVINLTATLPARLLAGLLAREGAVIRGFGLDHEGFGRDYGLWSIFLDGTTASRLSASYNLADMFRKVGRPAAGPACDAPRQRLAAPGPEAIRAAERLLSRAPARAGGFVCLQLGASAPQRQWPAASFAAVGDRLWREEGLCPVLLGASSEQGLGDAYAQAAREPFLTAIGKTDLPCLAAVLSRARLLVTNDTGTMHLAAGLGVPSLALFLATAQPCDTGPYLPGCCCLEPALPCHPCPYNRPCPNGFACVRRISAGSVGDLALAWLRTGAWENAPIPGIEREARIWLTGRDGRGFASVRRLTALPPDTRSLWLEHQRVFWGQLFDALDPGPHPAPLPLPDISAYPEQARRALGETLGQAAALLDLLVEQGGMLGKSAMAGTLFLRNCERLQAILDASAELRALGGFWRVLRQECGDRKEDLLETLARLARHTARWRDLFADGMAFAMD